MFRHQQNNLEKRADPILFLVFSDYSDLWNQYTIWCTRCWHHFPFLTILRLHHFFNSTFSSKSSICCLSSSSPDFLHYSVSWALFIMIMQLVEKQRLIEFAEALRSRLNYFDELENVRFGIPSWPLPKKFLFNFIIIWVSDRVNACWTTYAAHTRAPCIKFTEFFKVPNLEI